MRCMFIAFVTVAVAISCFAQTDGSKTNSTDTNVIAIVLGKKITIDEKEQVDGLILGALLEQFAKENKIEPTDDELDAFLKKNEEKNRQHEVDFERDRQKLQQELMSQDISDHERKAKEAQLQTIDNILKTLQRKKDLTKGMEEQMRPMELQRARRWVMAWKINKALYGKYGGRVIFQQSGFEPLDAYRDFLKEGEKKGTFQIVDKSYQASFWRYFTNDAMHTFCAKDEGDKFMNTPWWMMEKPQEE